MSRYEEEDALLAALYHTIALLRKEREENERQRRERESGAQLLNNFDKQIRDLKQELRTAADARDDAIASEEEMRRHHDHAMEQKEVIAAKIRTSIGNLRTYEGAHGVTFSGTIKLLQEALDTMYPGGSLGR